ncbi:MAG: hypothetical protein WBV85_10205 [Solirubrobacteraceae bacterium]
MDSTTRPIDVDNPETWPVEVVDWVRPEAERLRGSTIYTGDLDVSLELEDEFRQLLTRPLVAYHCTRLLSHEAQAIRCEGLRMLSRQLVDERIARAEQSGDLDGPTASRLRAGNVYALNAQENRDSQVCLVLGRRTFDQPSNRAIPLLEAWGGEAVNGGPQDAETNPVIGRPSIVVAAIDLSVSWRVSPTFPALDKMFVAALLDLQDRTADVLFRAPIASSMVLDIWQPGDAEYDRHASLRGV